MILLVSVYLNAEIITITGQTIQSGNFVGQGSLANQTIDFAITVDDGLTFDSNGFLGFNNPNNTLVVTINGTPLSANLTPVIAFAANSGLGIIAATSDDQGSQISSGDNGVEMADANQGESLAQYFTRVGTNFTSDTAGGIRAGLVLGGQAIENDIVINIGEATVATTDAVPEPSTYVLLSLLGLGFLLYRRRVF